MGINQILYGYIGNYSVSLGHEASLLRDFLFNFDSFWDRQKKAIKIIEKIMKHHGKKPLLSQVAELARVEHSIKELEPSARDHVVHAVLSFLLGIYLNENFLKLRINDFQWKVAALFHDVGYPVQIAGKALLKPFEQTVNRIAQQEEGITNEKIRFEIRPIGIENLPRGDNSFELIGRCLNNWGLRINPKEKFENMIASSNICHGIISSLSVLYVIDSIYKKYNPDKKKDVPKRGLDGNTINWGQEYFDEDIIHACSAIFVHNLKGNCFKKSKIDKKKTPLAFLLKLSDCLQDWERPSGNKIKGFPDEEYGIEISKDGIDFYAPGHRVKKIRNGIDSCLEEPEIKIHKS